MQKKPLTEFTPRALHLLRALKSSHTGAAIYEHVENVLEDYESSSWQTQKAYRELILLLLDEFAGQLSPESPLLIHVKLIKIRLSAPLGATEIRAISKQIHKLSEKLAAEITLPEKAIHQALEPLAAQPSTAQPTEPRTDNSIAEANQATAQVPPGKESVLLAEQKIGESHLKYYNGKHARISKIRENLTRQITEVIKQNEKFGVLLEVEHESLRQADSITELGALKETLIKEVTRLMSGHHALAKKLDNASKYLQIIESEGQYLNDELTRVHILSITDELTQLPNRRAFMRRLEDEVARVQRYGYPLSLILLDMDRFKTINDTYGHPAGDEVLRNFASNILTIFRHHDMVARYGGEEFAVVLPNTDQHGALRALQKVQQRIAAHPYHYNGETRPMPTFSAGISLYRPGETPGNLIERADKALYEAKRLGRNRIELADAEQIEQPAS